MSRETAESLPSLVCPLFVNPAKAVGKGEKPLHLPPFPEIDLNGEGFTFSHLHWVSIKAPNRERRRFEEWRVLLTVRHELVHKELSLTPFSLFKKHEMLRLYELILTIFEQGEQIPVPINPDESGNELEKQWEFIVRLHRGSRIIEEVFAIRSSLLYALKKGFIRDKLAQGIITRYKEGYGKVMPSFPEAYDAFDFVAGKIGKTAATALIHNVLGTANPLAAFEGIVFEMCKIDPRAPNGFVWNLEDHPESIANLSFEQAYHGFSRLTDYLDPDDSHYRRKILLEFEALMKREWSVVTQDAEDVFMKFLYGSPDTFLCSKYSNVIHPFVYPFSKVEFFKVEGSQEVEYGNPDIVLESIRQQLTQGKGLLCPFYAPHTCCGGLSIRSSLRKSGLVHPPPLHASSGSGWVVLRKKL
jgi:hypothetical protein